jgi:dienelactone hydrolase
VLTRVFKADLLMLGKIFILVTAVLAVAASITTADEKAVAIPTTNGLSLSATLTTPPGPAPAAGWPALVLIQGSGPTDRDGNSRLIPGVKIDLLRQISAALADAGIATIRFDKRGMNANTAQRPADPAQMPPFFDWDRFVDDGVAAYQFLDTAPGIDPGRVGLLGHSEGGSLALVSADRLKADKHPPKVLVLLGTMGRSEEDVLTDQLTRVMTAQKATPEQMKTILDANHRIAAEIKRTGRVPADVPPGLKALYPQYLGPFLKGSFSVDDLSLAAAFAGPVLVINGEKDAQVSPALDAGALDTKLKTRRPDDHELLIVPAASHNLKHVTGDTDQGLAGPVVPEALEKICAWSRQKLGVP